MDNSFLTTLIQGGAVGICLVTLWIHYKGDTRCSKAIENNTEAHLKSVEASTKMICAIESLEKIVRLRI